VIDGAEAAYENTRDERRRTEEERRRGEEKRVMGETGDRQRRGSPAGGGP
jgi:hypothetical protein